MKQTLIETLLYNSRRLQYPLSVTDKTTRQKIHKEMEDLNKPRNQLDLTDIFRTLHPTTAQYTFLSTAYGTLSRIDHMLGHKTSLNRFLKIESIQSIFSNHNGMKLEINSRRETGKSTNMWKLNNTLFNNQ